MWKNWFGFSLTSSDWTSGFYLFRKLERLRHVLVGPGGICICVFGFVYLDQSTVHQSICRCSIHCTIEPPLSKAMQQRGAGVVVVIIVLWRDNDNCNIGSCQPVHMSTF